MWNKMINVVVLMSLVLLLLPIQAQAASGTCGENLTWVFDEATGTLTISGIGDMDNDGYDYPSWNYSYAPKIKSVVVKEGVTSLGKNAFAYCTNLTSVTLPNTLTAIEYRAFCDCHNLTSVTIPGSVTYIGPEAFYYCKGLTEIKIPEGVTSIGEYTFFNCANLTKVTFPDGLISIGRGTFMSAGGLTSQLEIVIPCSVTEIGEDAFAISDLLFAHYNGTSEQWDAITIGEGNDELIDKIICLVDFEETVRTVSGDLSIEKPTKEEIQKAGKIINTDSIVFDIKPSVVAPYATGVIADYSLSAGENYLNYVRLAANLPLVQLDARLTEDAQYGAVLLAANGELPFHYYKPDDMDEEFFDRGHDAARNALQHGQSRISSINDFPSFLDDFKFVWDKNSGVAFKTYFLDPTLDKVGFGYTRFPDDYLECYLMIPGNSEKEIEYDFISWPASGNFPNDLLSIREVWMIELNSKKYLSPSLAQLKITVTRKSDQKVWQFEGKSGDKNDFETSFLDILDNTIYFRIGSNDNKNVEIYDGIYTVEVSGINYVTGAEAKLQYDVDFFDITKCVSHNFDIVENQVASCSKEGMTVKVCNICGYEVRETHPVLEHTWENGRCVVCGTVPRLAGSHRYETAFLAANQLKVELGIEKFDAVVVASGTSFADALSGSYLAAVKDAPILLASGVEKVDVLVKDYIRENLNVGGTVYILGGESAVPGAFENGLDGFAVKRLAGGNRFETNLMVLEEAGIGDKPVLVCTGLSFADSLSASATELPILLVWKELNEGQEAIITGLAEKGVPCYIIGGESAVSGEMEDEIAGYGVAVERVAGGNRFETSVAIAEKFFEKPESAVLAYAGNFPDGLCGGSLAAAMDAPLILTMDKFEAKAAEYVRGNGVKNGVILGGTGLISDGTVNSIFG